MNTKKGFTGHHLLYPNEDHKQQELICPIRNKEHYAISIIQRFRYVSWGFVISIVWELFKLVVKKLYPILEKDAKES